MQKRFHNKKKKNKQFICLEKIFHSMVKVADKMPSIKPLVSRLNEVHVTQSWT